MKLIPDPQSWSSCGWSSSCCSLLITLYSSMYACYGQINNNMVHRCVVCMGNQWSTLCKRGADLFHDYGGFFIYFFFFFTLDFPINFNISWQHLTAKTKDFFFRVIETDWPRVLLPSTDSRLHLLPTHTYTQIHTHAQCKQLKPWIRIKWPETSAPAGEMFRM